jgi:hypothetical protein
MAAYNLCLQIAFILVQIAFLALGGVLIGVGAWLEIQEQTIVEVVDQQVFLVGPYLLIAAGCFIVVIALIGMFGAFCDSKINRFLLILYIILVLLVFAAELVGGILSFVYREQVQSFVTEGIGATFERYNGTNTADVAITLAWDTVQSNLGCCGISNVTDWIFSNNSRIDTFPQSCCDPDPPCDITGVYTDGCEQQVTLFVREQLLIIAAIGIAFIVGEIIVVLMAFCLLCCTDFDDRD